MHQQQPILIIDDDRDMRWALGQLLLASDLKWLKPKLEDLGSKSQPVADRRLYYSTCECRI